MSPATIVQLVIALGPAAFQFIQNIVALWEKPSLTVDEVMTICAAGQKSYDQYIAEAKAKFATPAAVPVPTVVTPAGGTVNISVTPPQPS